MRPRCSASATCSNGTIWGGALLGEKKLLMREGTLIDASILAAPSSTKNRRRERDPEMHRSKKGNQW